MRYHLGMASVIKKSNSRYWFAAYRIPQAEGLSKLVLKSTGQINKTKAKQAATDMERAAQAEASAEGEQSQRILGVLSRATEHASRGKLTASRGREFMREIVTIATGEDLKDFTIEEWANAWLDKQRHLADATQAAYRTAVSNLMSFLGVKRHHHIEAITSADIVEFVQWLRDGGSGRKASGKTIESKMKYISAMFNDAKTMSLRDSNPVAGVKLPAAESVVNRQPFEMAEVNQLILAAKDSEWRRFITLAAFTGFRMGDCMQMEWSVIDMDKRIIVITPQKTKREGIEVPLPMHPALYASLSETPPKERKGMLLPTISKMTSAGSRGMSTMFVKLMNDAGVSRGKSQTTAGRTLHARSFHSLRHTFTKFLVDAGIPPEIRMKLTGHTKYSTHEIYSHIDPTIMMKAVKSIPPLPDHKS